MTYVSLILSEPAAAACISEIGVLGCMQFTDMNPELTPFQRKFVTNIKRCDEIERKIRLVCAELKKLNVEIKYASTSALDNFIKSNPNAETGSFVLEELDSKLSHYEQQLVELNRFGTKLQDEYNSKVSGTKLRCRGDINAVVHRWNCIMYLLKLGLFFYQNCILWGVLSLQF